MSDPAGPVPPSTDSASTADAWSTLLGAARIMVAEQDLYLRYTAIIDGPAGGPFTSACIGRLDIEVLPGEAGERLGAVKHDAIESGTPQQVCVDVPTEAGVRTLEVTATPRRDGHGRITGVLSAAVDITDIRRAQVDDSRIAALVESRTLEGIGRLAGGVAHDFNNLLTVILGYCELLRLRQRGGADLDEIANAARRAGQITRQLLAFGQRQALQVDTVDMNALIRGLARMLRRVLGESIALDVDPGDESAWVVADVGQIEQVLLNLVIHARDAMPSGGTLRIATRIVEADAREAGRSVEVTVRDSGDGLREEDRRRVFEPFFPTARTEGGLDLAAAHGIVTQTGGTLVCESTVGAGTTFVMRLPLGLPPAAAQRVANGTPDVHARGDEVVLLAGDEPLVRELAARSLREYGYRVLEAQDADSVVRHVEQALPSLVVSDVAPSPDGLDLPVEIARRWPDLPVIVLTGRGSASTGGALLPSSVLRKPFSPTDLATRVRTLLDESQGLKPLASI